MTALLIILLILAMILLMPCGIYARYCGEQIVAKLIIGPFGINLLRPKKKNRKPQKSGQPNFESKAKVKEKKRISDFWPILESVFDFLSDFKQRLTIKDLQFKLTLGGDPFTLSVNYGRYWALLGNLIPHLDSWFKIQNRNLDIQCDYTASNTKVEASIDLRLSVFTLLHMVVHHGIRILIKYIKISKEAKDGAIS